MLRSGRGREGSWRRKYQTGKKAENQGRKGRKLVAGAGGVAPVTLDVTAVKQLTTTGSSAGTSDPLQTQRDQSMQKANSMEQAAKLSKLRTF